MSRFDRPIKGVRQYSPLLHLFESGTDAAHLKAGCRSILRPYFIHPENVDLLPEDILLGQAVNLGQVLAKPTARELFTRCLAVHRSAAEHNLAAAIEACAKC